MKERKFCLECKDKKQIGTDDFIKLPFELARQLDCKNILPNGNQCLCYSIENATDKKEINEYLKKEGKE